MEEDEKDAPQPQGLNGVFRLEEQEWTAGGKEMRRDKEMEEKEQEKSSQLQDAEPDKNGQSTPIVNDIDVLNREGDSSSEVSDSSDSSDDDSKEGSRLNRDWTSGFVAYTFSQLWLQQGIGSTINIPELRSPALLSRYINVMNRENQTMETDFFLLGFPNLHKYKMFLFVLFLLIYIMTLAANFIIIVLVATSRHLKSPMYFFLSHLSLSDIFLTTNISPNMLHIILGEGGSITFAGCIIQFYLLGCSGIAECLLLTVMSYDRYMAICNPLHYTSVMHLSFCCHLVTFCWLLGSGLMLITATLVSKLQFCGSMKIDYFFCDFAPLIELSCSDTSIVEIENILLAVPVTLFPFGFIIVTYVCIFLTILRISSGTERQKAFSTCSSHLIVVCMYYGTLVTIYVNPYRGNSLDINKILSLLYTVATPFFNPIIYSLRNKEIRTVLSMTKDNKKEGIDLQKEIDAVRGAIEIKTTERVQRNMEK
ncbi:olfactory receptor 6F1-like [Rhinophrynus dorsalis]